MTQLERFFGWFGEGIAKHPLIIISICLVFVSVCSVGFVWFKAKNRGVDLYIPQGSRSMEDLDKNIFWNRKILYITFDLSSMEY